MHIQEQAVIAHDLSTGHPLQLGPLIQVLLLKVYDLASTQWNTR